MSGFWCPQDQDFRLRYALGHSECSAEFHVIRLSPRGAKTTGGPSVAETLQVGFTRLRISNPARDVNSYSGALSLLSVVVLPMVAVVAACPPPPCSLQAEGQALGWPVLGA